jgi:hypothetical protein
VSAPTEFDREIAFREVFPERRLATAMLLVWKVPEGRRR